MSSFIAIKALHVQLVQNKLQDRAEPSASVQTLNNSCSEVVVLTEWRPNSSISMMGWACLDGGLGWGTTGTAPVQTALWV